MHLDLIWTWFQMGFFGGFGFCTISLLFSLVFKK